MWIVVYVTPVRENADKLTQSLANNGIISKIRKAPGGDSTEVLVPQAELSKAQELIFELE